MRCWLVKISSCWFRKLSDAVDNKVIKEGVYNAKIKDIEDKTPNITSLATTAVLNAKIYDDKKEIHIS